MASQWNYTVLWMSYTLPYMPNNQIFSWSKGYSVYPIFVYFAHIFHSPSKIKALIFAIPVICQVTIFLVSNGWLFFFVLPPGFWAAFMPHWSWYDMCWLICKENCWSKDDKRMKSIYTWNLVQVSLKTPQKKPWKYLHQSIGLINLSSKVTSAPFVNWA